METTTTEDGTNIHTINLEGKKSQKLIEKKKEKEKEKEEKEEKEEKKSSVGILLSCLQSLQTTTTLSGEEGGFWVVANLKESGVCDNDLVELERILKNFCFLQDLEVIFFSFFSFFFSFFLFFVCFLFVFCSKKVVFVIMIWLS